MQPVLGVDWGDKRLGLAISDSTRTLARPLCVLSTQGLRHSVSLVREQAAEHQATRIVIGLPLLPSGEEGDSARRARKLGASLASKGLEVVYRDERFSSRDAQERIRELRRRPEEDDDAVAAALVLQSYLDEEAP